VHIFENSCAGTPRDLEFFFFFSPHFFKSKKWKNTENNFFPQKPKRSSERVKDTSQAE